MVLGDDDSRGGSGYTFLYRLGGDEILKWSREVAEVRVHGLPIGGGLRLLAIKAMRADAQRDHSRECQAKANSGTTDRRVIKRKDDAGK